MADFTQADLDAVNKAIASGELSVRYGDKSVTYRGIDELLRAQEVIKRAVQSPTVPSFTLASFSKG